MNPSSPRPRPLCDQATTLTSFLDEAIIRAARGLVHDWLYSEPFAHIALPGTAPGLVGAPPADVVASLATIDPTGSGAMTAEATIAADVAVATAAPAAALSLPALAATHTTEEVRDLNGLAIPAMLEATMRVAAGVSAFRALCSPRQPATVMPALRETPEFSALPLRPAKAEAHTPTDGIIDLTPDDDGAASSFPVGDLLAASPLLRQVHLSHDSDADGEAVESARGGKSLTAAGPAAKLAGVTSLQRRGGLCAMLDAIEGCVPDQPPERKRKRLDQTDADDEFRQSLAEIRGEVWRAAHGDPLLTWAPLGDGSKGGPRIPRPPVFLRIASLYQALQGGYISKHRQLLNFDWMPEEAAAACIGVARALIPDLEGAEFEVPLACAEYVWCDAGRGLIRQSDLELQRAQTSEAAAEAAAVVAVAAAAAVVPPASPSGDAAASDDNSLPPASEPMTLLSPYAKLHVTRATATAAGVPATAALAATLLLSPASTVPIDGCDGFDAQAVAAAMDEACRPVVIEGMLDVGACWDGRVSSVQQETSLSRVPPTPPRNPARPRRSHCDGRVGAQVRPRAARGALLAARHLCVAVGGGWESPITRPAGFSTCESAHGGGGAFPPGDGGEGRGEGPVDSCTHTPSLPRADAVGDVGRLLQADCPRVCPRDQAAPARRLSLERLRVPLRL